MENVSMVSFLVVAFWIGTTALGYTPKGIEVVIQSTIWSIERFGLKGAYLPSAVSLAGVAIVFYLDWKISAVALAVSMTIGLTPWYKRKSTEVHKRASDMAMRLWNLS